MEKKFVTAVINFFYQGDRRDDADLFHQSVRDSR